MFRDVEDRSREGRGDGHEEASALHSLGRRKRGQVDGRAVIAP